MRLTKLSLMAAVVALLQAIAASANETNRCPACCVKSLPAMSFTDKSLYQLDSKWTTDTGKEITLESLAGKPQVVLMFFSHCTTACPLLVHDLRRIEAALTPEVRAKVGFTLVSFDSDRDTPVALAEYRKEWNLPQSWTLLHGSADNVSELAALLGVQYKKDADGQFVHSNVITLLDASGQINSQQTGSGGDPGALVQKIENLAK